MTDSFAFAISSEIDSLLLQQLMQHLQESNEEGYDPQSLFHFLHWLFLSQKEILPGPSNCYKPTKQKQGIDRSTGNNFVE